MDRMSAMDAGFYLAESEKTPLHMGSVAVFDGPAPSYGDLVRLLLGKLPQVPRYRQRVQEVPLYLGRPVWADDQHFQILYHVRHTALPKPGTPDQLRNLAGRVLGHRLDLSKPLWELWLVEGLEQNRWAIINKIHHAMVDGVGGTDLMQLVFDLDPHAEHPDPQPWMPAAASPTLSIVAHGVADSIARPLRQLAALPADSAHALSAPRELLRRGGVLAGALVTLGRQVATPVASSLNGPIGPHRRWSWSDTTIEDVGRVRKAFGGTMNDVVLTAITGGFRDLLEARGELTPRLVVRSLVPVSVRQKSERGTLNNQVSAVFVDLPVGEPSPLARLESLRRQMDSQKRLLGVYDAHALLGAGDLIAPALLAIGVRALLRRTQPWSQAVTTNVPGPRVPLYLLGRRMTSLYPYVPLGAGVQISIGIFSYVGKITFGINADFDAVPDVDVLARGIGHGLDELLDLVDQQEKDRADPAPAAAKPVRSVKPVRPVTSIKPVDSANSIKPVKRARPPGTRGPANASRRHP